MNIFTYILLLFAIYVLATLPHLMMIIFGCGFAYPNGVVQLIGFFICIIGGLLYKPEK